MKKIYELNCDCTPFYLSLTDTEASELREAIKPIAGFIDLVEIEPVEISTSVLIQVCKDAVSSDGAIVKGILANRTIETFMTMMTIEARA